ncbi:hypothetical protein SSME_23410 [Staphylococcus saprophyticus subsp. saprophyticus KACC 16562]|nr:hypothetical protein SSME_23410 [Staphylococcus saprophyticus subsp. saprophyticus KACC 16562]
MPYFAAIPDKVSPDLTVYVDPVDVFDDVLELVEPDTFND